MFYSIDGRNGITDTCEYALLCPKTLMTTSDSVAYADGTSPAEKSYGTSQPLVVPPLDGTQSKWIPLGPYPFMISKMGLDLIGIDKFTEACHFVSAKAPNTARQPPRGFFHSILRLPEVPTNIASNRDAQFSSLFQKTLS